MIALAAPQARCFQRRAIAHREVPSARARVLCQAQRAPKAVQVRARGLTRSPEAGRVCDHGCPRTDTAGCKQRLSVARVSCLPSYFPLSRAWAWVCLAAN